MGNGIRLAQHFGCDYRFVWERRADVADISNPAYLFDVEAMLAQRVAFTEFNQQFFQGAQIYYHDGCRAVIDRPLLESTATAIICGCGHFQRLSNENLFEARIGLRKALRSVVPSQEISDAIAKFARQGNLSSAVGIHVRRGDIVSHSLDVNRQRAIALDEYFFMIDTLVGKGDSLFLCAEDADVISEFERRYPGRIFYYQTSTWDRRDKNGVLQAFIEILLLGETRFITGGLSAFNRAASALGLRPLLTIENLAQGDPKNLLLAASEFLNFDMIDQAEVALAAAPAARETEQGRRVLKRLARLKSSVAPAPTDAVGK